MSELYHVKIEKERLVFSAAHFITYDGNTCEPLHGHNYHVAAEVRANGKFSARVPLNVGRNRIVVVTEDVSPDGGKVEYKGAAWSARSESEIAAGEHATVVAVEGITLVVSSSGTSS